MQLYELLTPVWTNDREKNYEPQRKELEAFILAQCGGFSRPGLIAGSWRNDDGKVFDDKNYAIRFAIGPGYPAALQLIVEKALELFSDQEALFIVKVGDAFVVERSNASAALAELASYHT